MAITNTNFFLASEMFRRISTPPPAPKKEMEPVSLPRWFQQNQVGACGVSSIYSFGTQNLATLSSSEVTRLKSSKKETLHQNSGGCGFASAAFIDTPECKAMYKQLKEWFPILYQSPIRFNVNSGNNFFFCIFDTGEKEVPPEYSDEDYEGFEHLPSATAAGFPNGLEW